MHYHQHDTHYAQKQLIRCMQKSVTAEINKMHITGKVFFYAYLYSRKSNIFLIEIERKVL